MYLRGIMDKPMWPTILVLKYIFYPQKIGVHNFLRRVDEGFKGNLETR